MSLSVPFVAEGNDLVRKFREVLVCAALVVLNHAHQALAGGDQAAESRRGLPCPAYRTALFRGNTLVDDAVGRQVGDRLEIRDVGVKIAATEFLRKILRRKLFAVNNENAFRLRVDIRRSISAARSGPHDRKAP